MRRYCENCGAEQVIPDEPSRPASPVHCTECGARIRRPGELPLADEEGEDEATANLGPAQRSTLVLSDEPTEQMEPEEHRRILAEAVRSAAAEAPAAAPRAAPSGAGSRALDYDDEGPTRVGIRNPTGEHAAAPPAKPSLLAGLSFDDETVPGQLSDLEFGDQTEPNASRPSADLSEDSLLTGLPQAEVTQPGRAGRPGCGSRAGWVRWSPTRPRPGRRARARRRHCRRRRTGWPSWSSTRRRPRRRSRRRRRQPDLAARRE